MAKAVNYPSEAVKLDVEAKIDFIERKRATVNAMRDMAPRDTYQRGYYTAVVDTYDEMLSVLKDIKSKL